MNVANPRPGVNRRCMALRECTPFLLGGVLFVTYTSILPFFPAI
jgi:hypothetical protein